MSSESDAQSTGTAGSKRPSRKRGTAFPVVHLSEAAGILKEAGKYGFEHATASFATYMGHSTVNSGSFRQRLAAFRDWELITGRGDTLTMTEVAQRIAMPTDEAAERRALQQAFKNCGVFTGLYEKMAKGKPIDPSGLGAQAVHGFGVAPSKASQFVRSFVESVLAAHLAETDDEGNVVLLEPGDNDQADDDGMIDEMPTATEQIDSRSVPSALSVGREPKGALSPTIRQSWQVTGGEIVFELRSATALPAAVFGAIGKLMEGLEALAESLNESDDLDSADEGAGT